jgi:hypothetical protein
MLIEVLIELDKPGIKSTKNIEEKLGVSSSMLEYILSDLEQRGYIKKEIIIGGNCASCTQACPFAGSNSSPLSTWEITEKGKKIVDNRTNKHNRHIPA